MAKITISVCLILNITILILCTKKTHLYFSSLVATDQNQSNNKINKYDILTPLSAMLQLYRGGQFIGGGNRSTREKPTTCRKSLTNFIT